MVVHLVQFDDELWTDILQESGRVYGGLSPPLPTRLSQQSKTLQARIKQFPITNVKLLCEVPSLKVNVSSQTPPIITDIQVIIQHTKAALKE